MQEKSYFLMLNKVYKVEFYRKAKIEYNEIWKYIAQDNLFYANEVLDHIDKSIVTICIFPLIWKDVWEWLRLIVEPKYKYNVVYRVIWEKIYIVSVFKYKNSWE